MRSAVRQSGLWLGCPLTGRYRVISGQHMLNTSSSHFDPVAVIRRIEIPQCSGLLAHRGVLSLSGSTGAR